MSFDREQLSRALPAYDIGDQLGQGGMGVVISGQHRHLGRRVAIKQLPAAFAADPEVRRRFTAEARVLASLDHPHVVPVYDFVERDGICLLVMELLPGGTLRSRVAAAGGFTAPHLVAVCLACASGLAAAHRHGVLHRDVKPENMLFAASGVLKVADFGIAKVLGGAGTVLTRRGEVIGTPAYMAPEQVRGGQVTPATDVYATATMLYELLAGVLPFPDDGQVEDLALLFKHAYEQPVPLRDVAPGVPDPLAAVVMRALATEPADRFESAESFGAALAGAGTQAWGEGWLAAEQVPIMDAGPITGAASRGTGPRHQDGPTTVPAAPAATMPPAGGMPPAQAMPAAGAAPTAGATPAHPSADRSGRSLGGDRGGRPPRSQRSRIIVMAVVAVIVIAVVAVLVFGHLFTVYGSGNG